MLNPDFAGFFSAEAIEAAVRQSRGRQQQGRDGGGGDNGDDGTGGTGYDTDGT